MAATLSISADKLFRLVGTPHCPPVIDVRTSEEFAADPWLVPGSRLRSADGVAEWAEQFARGPAIVLCAHGHASSAGVAALLRASGIDAETLEGGMEAWTRAGHGRVKAAALPSRDEEGRTIWVTRARPKVDRIACPWLIRRFVDPDARLLFVAPADVPGVAERFGAAPFDVDGVFWSHRGDLCTFDVMVEELGLSAFIALERLAIIVRGADTAHPDIAPQAAGLLAASLGLSRMYSNDLEQLEAGMLLYDAFYRWCRDATDETHDWVSHTPKAKVRA